MEFFKTINLPTIITFLGAILVAVGALWSSHISSKKELEQAKENSEFQKKIADKNEEIAKLSIELSKTILGGDSFCYVEFSFLNDNTAVITLVHQGNYPLYDINVRMVDLENVYPHVKAEELFKKDISFNINSLTQTSASMDAKIDLGHSVNKRYNIFFLARNGDFDELLRYKKIGTVWYKALRVIKRVKKGDKIDRDIIFETIDKDYPLNNEGKVDWD